jgi:hypothetical protein
MLPVKNSNNKMAKTKVSTTAASKMPFFLFMIQCLLLCLKCSLFL